MSTQRPAERVTTDARAEDRLHDLEIEIHDGGRGAIACINEDSFSVVACVDRDVNQGRLHEALAGVFLQLALTVEWNHRGDDA